MREYVLADDMSWDAFLDPESRARLDPNIRLVASLIDIGDTKQVFRRTGIVVDASGVLEEGNALPLFLDFHPGMKDETLERITLGIRRVDGELRINEDARKHLLGKNKATILATALAWNPGAVTQEQGRTPKPADAFRATISRLVRDRGIRRVSIPTLLQPCLHESLHDIGLPRNRRFNNVTLDGRGVVVGIIDDGCALAHRNFLAPRVPGDPPKSRIQYLWDQTRLPLPNPNPGPWTSQAPGATTPVEYGQEIGNKAINDVLQTRFDLNTGLIDEEAVHEDLQYEIGISSHGTHVMDIAAGNGVSMLSTPGVAPASDIIFVQLPSPLVDDALPLLDSYIHSAVRYIFQRARDLGGPTQPVVINISYGGYTGPHDGSSAASKGIDDELSGTHDRAVVISAGNSFEADCHAQGTVVLGSKRSLQWNLSPEDPTTNSVEIWYEENARLSMALRMPGPAQIFAPIHLGDAKVLLVGGKIMGWMENVASGAGLPNVIRILLNETVGEPPDAVSPVPPLLIAPCPSGTWVIDLFNDLPQAASFHAWIGRDDWRRGVVSGHQQSRFAPSDADPRSTLVDLATGRLTICVGAHNGDTSEVCTYSAAGPTRDGRPKPDLTAPAEEDATRQGILCASSRRSQPTWFNGTSASAPVVTGMVALMFQYNRQKGGPPLSASDVLTRLRNGALAFALVGNKRQDVDPHRPPGKTQSDHLGDVVGAGKARVLSSLP